MSARTAVDWYAHRPLMEWLANGEQGLSSRTIVAHLTGVVQRDHFGPQYPHDAGDFRRCEVLLRRVPLLRFMLPEMSSACPEWAALVGIWDEIVASMESEIPGVFDGSRYHSGAAPVSYNLIRAALDGSRA